MKTQRGFTLIELIIAIAIFTIFVMVIVGAGVSMNGNSTVSVGINGVTEVRCIAGYKFVVGDRGQAHQILDEFGKGARCDGGLK